MNILNKVKEVKKTTDKEEARILLFSGWILVDSFIKEEKICFVLGRLIGVSPKEYKYQAYQCFDISHKGIDGTDICKVEMRYQTDNEFATSSELNYQLLKTLTKCIDIIALKI